MSDRSHEANLKAKQIRFEANAKDIIAVTTAEVLMKIVPLVVDDAWPKVQKLLAETPGQMPHPDIISPVMGESLKKIIGFLTNDLEEN